MAKNDFVRRLAEHPKLMGVLFTTAVLLTQAGMVVAENDGCLCTGP